ncbi:MAG: hypothetical protein ACI9TA_002086 [Reinekea sp.]
MSVAWEKNQIMILQVPDLVTLQEQLFECVYTASQFCGIPVVLGRYCESPRMGLQVTTYQAAMKLLRACVADDLKISDPDTHDTITLQMLDHTPRARLRLWTPIIVEGRMIHGPMSGIDLVIVDDVETVEQVTFPHPAFTDLWLNGFLAGRTMPVTRRLLQLLATTRQPKQVDIVLTWVDDNDPIWREKYRQHSASTVTKDATDPARFANHDELRYALRGIFRYYDGIGSVYLVTDGQIPLFWDEFQNRVTIIDHAQIMSTDVTYPTFNSHVIESCLHKIPNLAAQYLYFNDDFILTNPTSISDFFDNDGCAKVFFSAKTFIPEGQTTPNMLAADAAAVNARDLFQSRFARTITRKFKHCPVALHRDIMVHLETTFADKFATIRKNRFRNPGDLAVSGSFYQHYALMIGRAISADIPYQYLEINTKKVPLMLLRLSVMSAWNRPVVLCLNAVTGGAASRFNQWVVKWHMRRLLPASGQVTRRTPRIERLHYRLLNIIAWGGRLLGKI